MHLECVRLKGKVELVGSLWEFNGLPSTCIEASRVYKQERTVRHFPLLKLYMFLMYPRLLTLT